MLVCQQLHLLSILFSTYIMYVHFVGKQILTALHSLSTPSIDVKQSLLTRYHLSVDHSQYSTHKHVVVAGYCVCRWYEFIRQNRFALCVLNEQFI